MTGLKNVFKDAFEIDKEGTLKLKDNIESISFFITPDGAKVERKFLKEKKNAKKPT